MMNRRHFLSASLATLPLGAWADEPKTLPVTGEAEPRLVPFDQLLISFLTENQIPGAAFALARKGRLILARGYGYANPVRETPVQPGSRFRIASISKPLTAVAVLQQAERKKLGLDDFVLDYLKMDPLGDAKPDPRWAKITVRHCLRHTGGWDRDKSFDPIARPTRIAQALKQDTPVSPEQIIRYMQGFPLDFDPGSQYGYSNLGYLILGRILEKVTGKKYEELVQREVLAPLGIRGPQLGRALPEHRAAGEVTYHDASKREAPCLYPPRRNERVPFPDGAENFEAFEAHGGWISSAVDLVRFATAFETPTDCPILSAASIESMWARPEGRPGWTESEKPKTVYYGCGWSVRPTTDGGINAWHSGLIAGTSTLLVRQPDGIAWAVLFNKDRTANSKTAAAEIEPKIYQTVKSVTTWPNRDLFDRTRNRPN